MAYTQEQLKSMNSDRLVEIIIQSQTQEQSTIQEQQPPTANPVATSETTTIQTDIETIKAAIADLEAKGKDLFAEEIANLTAKLDNAQKELENFASDAETEIKTFEQKFREKHGVSIWGVVIVGGYVVWQVVTAIVGALK